MNIRLDIICIFALLGIYLLRGVSFNDMVIVFLTGIAVDVATIRYKVAAHD